MPRVGNESRGFSMIEIMAVVAIIALIVFVAAPNLRRYQARAKQTQAKAELSGLYTAERAFFTESSTYHPILNYIGFKPDEITLSDPPACTLINGKPRFYTIGFEARNGWARSVPGWSPLPPIACQRMAYFLTNSPIFDLTADVVTGNYMPTNTGFTAVAAGVIVDASGLVFPFPATFYDTWTINESKDLRWVNPGI